MESKHTAELLTMEASNGVATKELVAEAKREWDLEQKTKIGAIHAKMETERRSERNGLLELVKRVGATRARLEEELEEEEIRRREEEEKDSREKRQLEENLSRFPRGMRGKDGGRKE